MTRASIVTYINKLIASNGTGGITGPILNAVLAFMNSDYATLDDTNTYSGLQLFQGGVSEARYVVSDVNYTVVSGIRYVVYSAITAPRTVQLLASSSYVPGQRIRIGDVSGSVSSTKTITITAAGADTINGLSTLVLQTPLAGLDLESNGINGWTIVASQAATIPSNTIIGNFGTTTAVPGITSPPVGFRNRIINGDFVVDQRNGGALQSAIATNTYMTDRYKYSATVSKFNAQQNYNSVTPPAGFTNYQGLVVASAYTVTSSDTLGILQAIEGFSVSDLNWGTANALPVTLSFWVYSSVAGTHSGALRNSTGTQSYTFGYTVPTPNTWTFVSFTVPGCTTGTWLNTSGVGIFMSLNLGSGSSLQTTAGLWTAGNFTACTGAVSVVGTAAATFYTTGWQLEPGNYVTPFERTPIGVSLIRCMRYYEKYTSTGLIIRAYPAASTGSAYGWLPFKATKRAAPTMSVGSPTYNAASAASFANTTLDGSELNFTVSGTGAYAFVPWTADAEL